MVAKRLLYFALFLLWLPMFLSKPLFLWISGWAIGEGDPVDGR